MIVCSFASVSEMHVASIFRVEVCRWSYCCVDIAVCFEKELQKGEQRVGNGGVGKLCRALSRTKECIKMPAVTYKAKHSSMWVRWCGDHYELTVDFHGDGKEE
jgi:hypothetical protein